MTLNLPVVSWLWHRKHRQQKKKVDKLDYIKSKNFCTSKDTTGNSLAVQWLGLCASTPRGPGSILVGELRFPNLSSPFGCMAWPKKKTQKAKINKDLVKSEETTYRENFVNQTSDKRLISRIQKRTTAQPKRPNLKQAGGDVFVGTVD